MIFCSFVSEKLIAHRSKSVCKDAKPVRANSRGFLNPWKTWNSHNYDRLQRRGFQYRGTIKSPDTLPIRVFADAFIIVSKKTEGLKAPGYSTSRLSDVFEQWVASYELWAFYGLLLFCLKKLKVHRSQNVMLNLFQHLSAVKDNPLSYSGSRWDPETSSGWHRVTLLII